MSVAADSLQVLMKVLRVQLISRGGMLAGSAPQGQPVGGWAHTGLFLLLPDSMFVGPPEFQQVPTARVTVCLYAPRHCPDCIPGGWRVEERAVLILCVPGGTGAWCDAVDT